MLNNIANFEDGHRFDADIVIIGGGPAGIALALEFANTPYQVLLLESGGLDFDAETQDLMAGPASGVPYFALDDSRYRMLGGSTFRWGARTAPFKPLDFETRDWLPVSGWPIARDELDAYYERVFDLIGIHRPFEFDGRVWNHVKARPLDLDMNQFEYTAFQFGRNLLFGSVYRDALQAASNVNVLLGANVLDIETGARANHVESLAVGHSGGRRYSVKASRYVLAAGGIENARLLLLSDRANPQGLANGNDLVGRYFMEHPTVSAGTIVSKDPQRLLDAFSPGLVGGRLVEVGLSLNAGRQRETGSLNAVARTAIVAGNDATQALRELLRNFQHRRLPHQLSWYQKNKWLMLRLGAIARDPFSIVTNTVRHALGLPNRFKIDSVYLELRTEQEPNPDSRVTLATETDAFGLRRPHLHWALTRRDKQTMGVLAEHVGSELERLEVGRLEIADWLASDDLSFGPDLVGGHHHMGTTRMSADPRQGVVNSDCRAHEVDNLYIAGASVFPTAGFVNPTASLLALTLRLADHLKAAN
jgi:choline dehydrogenase-like flavoprotein